MSVRAMGIFIDPTMTVNGSISKQITVQTAVGRMQPDLARRVSGVYDLNPPLDSTKMRAVHFPSNLELDDKLESAGSAPFTVLFYPNDDQKLHVQTRLTEARNSKQAVEDMSSQLTSLLDAMKDVNAKLEKQSATIEELWEKCGTQDEVIEVLEAKNEVQDGAIKILQADLDTEREARKEDIQSLIQVTTLITPLRLRVLLDLARQKVLQVFKSNTWEDLRENHNIQQLVDFVFRGLNNAPNCPSRNTIQFLCSYNNIRREGNTAAHTATVGEMRDAVTTKLLETRDRRCLEQVFKFAFNEDV